MLIVTPDRAAGRRQPRFPAAIHGLPLADKLLFAAIPGDVSIFGSAAQAVLSGSFTRAVGREGRCAKAPASQTTGYAGYATNLSLAASQDYTIAALCIPSGNATNGTTPTQDFVGAQPNFLSVGSNGFRATLDNNGTALNAWTDTSPALFMATRKGGTISAYVPSGVAVTAATGTRAQTFTTVAAGRYSGNNMISTETYLIMIWGRALALAEYLALGKNPWQMFSPPPRRIWIPDAGGVAIGTAFGLLRSNTANSSSKIAASGNASLLQIGQAGVAAKFSLADQQGSLSCRQSGSHAKTSLSGISAIFRARASGTHSKTATGGVQALLSSLSVTVAEHVIAGIITTAVAARLASRSQSAAAKVSLSDVSARLRPAISDSTSKIISVGVAALIKVTAADIAQKIVTGHVHSLLSLRTAIAAAPHVSSGVGLSQEDIDAIAEAVWAKIAAGFVPADVKRVNGVTVTGAGVTGNEWGPA